MDKNYDTKSIENILTMLKGFVYNVDHEDFFVNVYITTGEGLCRNLKISNNKENLFEINKNILVYKESVISLRDIIKIKISLQDIYDKNLKELLNKRLRNIILYNNRNPQIKNQGLVRKYNYKNDDYDMENYIQNNYKDIKKIRYSGISTESKDLGLNSKNYKVAKPIEVKRVDTVNNLDIKTDSIITKPVSTSAVKDINYNTSNVIKDLDINYINEAIVNIDKEKQILKSKKIEVLEIEPINKYIDKKELAGKALRVDPTGENYIGIVLDDGTFEPVKLNLNNYNVLQDDVKNYIGNIDINSQLQRVVTKVNSYKKEAIDNIQVEYNEDLVEYNQESIKKISDIITVSKENVNSILNYNDTLNIKTKDNVSNTIEESINGSIEIVGNGIMVVENFNQELVIYPTSKITSIN